MSDNPLQNYFRSKEIYISLPTNGRYFSEPINFNSDGEIGIMPMTAKDETLLKIPDTLFSGESLYVIVKSVAPDIIDPYELTIPDLDAVLLATRSVTYGDSMSIECTCPYCSNTEAYDVELKKLLANLKSIPKDVVVEIQGLHVKMKPNTVKVITSMGMAQIKSNQVTTQMAKMTEADENTSMDTFRELFDKSINEIAAAEIAIIADSIESVTLPDGQSITNLEHIIQWLSNTNSKMLETLKKHGKEQNNNGLPDFMTLQCSNEECGKEFYSALDLNPTFFFTNK